MAKEKQAKNDVLSVPKSTAGLFGERWPRELDIEMQQPPSRQAGDETLQPKIVITTPSTSDIAIPEECQS